MTETVITVQGQHSVSFPAERATVHLSISLDGGVRGDVFECATATAEKLRGLLCELHDEALGPIVHWSSESVRVWGERPWNSDGKQLAVVYHAGVDFRARFRDFDALARFIETTAHIAGVAIGYVEWTLTEEHLLATTVDVRAKAVQDAVAKATSYAHAIGLRRVTATAIADPGMLGNQGTSSHNVELASSSRQFGGSAGGPLQLSLKPEDIEVTARVDARFLATAE